MQPVRDGNEPAGPRILFASHTCYLDTHNGASVAIRSLMECLARRGFLASAMTGTVFESNEDIETTAWLIDQGLDFEAFRSEPNSDGDIDRGAHPRACYRLDAGGVGVLLHGSPTITSACARRVRNPRFPGVVRGISRRGAARRARELRGGHPVGRNPPSGTGPGDRGRLRPAQFQL